MQDSDLGPANKMRVYLYGSPNLFLEVRLSADTTRNFVELFYRFHGRGAIFERCLSYNEVGSRKYRFVLFTGSRRRLHAGLRESPLRVVNAFLKVPILLFSLLPLRTGLPCQ